MKSRGLEFLRWTCAGQLRRQGVRVKVQEQSFHILTVPLQQSGEVVNREDLRSPEEKPF